MVKKDMGFTLIKSNSSYAEGDVPIEHGSIDHIKSSVL